MDVTLFGPLFEGRSHQEFCAKARRCVGIVGDSEEAKVNRDSSSVPRIPAAGRYLPDGVNGGVVARAMEKDGEDAPEFVAGAGMFLNPSLPPAQN